MINEVLAIAAGGALGSSSRFAVSNALYKLLGENFPYGTLTVNVIGSFLMGILAIYILDRMPHYYPSVAGFVLVGFLGAFTTFSTFSMDTFRLIFDGHYVLSVINIVANVSICLLATMLGYFLAMKIFGLSP